MSNLLVSVILSVCPIPQFGGTSECMDNINNCAVQRAGDITKKSIVSCVKKETGLNVKLSDYTTN